MSQAAAHFPALPSEDLIYRVTGKRDADLFAVSGLLAVDDLEPGLHLLGRKFCDVRRALDLGCGPGRIARWLQRKIPDAFLLGCDIDEAAIAWAADALPNGNFVVNGHLPPLPLPAESIDFVYAWSLFTHLDESYQDAWLAELHRVTIPGASLLLTTSGEIMWEYLRTRSAHAKLDDLLARRADFDRTGFVFWGNDGWEQHFPAYYHTTFHTPQYVRAHWSSWFEVVDVVLGGAQPAQDMIVLRRR